MTDPNIGKNANGRPVHLHQSSVLLRASLPALRSFLIGSFVARFSTSDPRTCG